MHRNHPLLSSLFVVVASLTVGCGARVVDEEETLTPVPEEAYCLSSAKAECAQLAVCCDAVGLGGTVAACEAKKASACEASRKERAALGRVYDPRAAALCLAAHRSEAKCGAYPAPYQVTDAAWAGMTACSQVWLGRTPQGGTCSDDADCAPAGSALPVICRSPKDGAPKTCQVYRRLREGDDCSVSWALADCGYDLTCQWTEAGTARCVRRAARGQACSTTTFGSCADGLTCDPVTGTCADPRPVGAPCAPRLLRSTSFPDWACAAGAICDDFTHVCTAPSPTGAPCRPGGKATKDMCHASDHCDPAALRCVPSAALGATCVGDDACESGRCSGGRCVLNGGLAGAESCAALR